MSKITYSEVVTVYLDGDAVGEIRSEEGGYRYFPTFSLRGGELFTTLAACKASLEDD